MARLPWVRRTRNVCMLVGLVDMGRLLRPSFSPLEHIYIQGLTGSISYRQKGVVATFYQAMSDTVHLWGIASLSSSRRDGLRFNLTDSSDPKSVSRWGFHAS
jgi:hypothetical protein